MGPALVVLASAVIDIPAAFVEVAGEVKNKSFKAAITKLGMADGVITFVVDPALAGEIPEAVAARIEETRQGIVAGRVTVPSSEF